MAMAGRRAALITFAVVALIDCSPASDETVRGPERARQVSPPGGRVVSRATESPHDTDESHATEPEQVIGLGGNPFIGCPPAPAEDPTLASVELASWSVSKGHSTEVVRRILIRHADDVRACAKQLRGALDLDLFVAATGAVTKARARGSVPTLRPVATCLTQRMHDWRFVASQSPGRASIRARFVLLAPRPAAANAPSCAPSLH